MIVNKLAYKIIEIGNLVFNELGGGFNENVHQVGLAIELREAKIKYLRETNIEIFYKSHPVGLDTPDFILYPDKKKYGTDEPIILECKFSDKISDDNRQQLKSYLKSTPLNSNPSLNNINKGMLINFKKKESYKSGEGEISQEAVTLECWEYNRKKDKINIIFNSLNNDESITNSKSKFSGIIKIQNEKKLQDKESKGRNMWNFLKKYDGKDVVDFINDAKLETKNSKKGTYQDSSWWDRELEWNLERGNIILK